jgi:ribulose-phosphate 3-epimerase
MLVSPSVISCRLEYLASEISQCEKAGVYSYHLDVMDGSFVPNLTMGPDLIKAVRRCTKRRLESHLMIERPDIYAEKFIDAGSDLLFIHGEVLANFQKVISTIKEKGASFGIAINPETSIGRMEKWIAESDTVLLMSVHPGFSGQSFISGSLEKIRELRKLIDSNGYSAKIEVDGGVNDRTAQSCVDAGADILVSASYIFSGNIEERIGFLSGLTRS